MRFLIMSKTNEYFEAGNPPAAELFARISAHDGVISVTGDDRHEQLEGLWRIEFPRLVATATRITRDTDLAEQVAQDAFVAALEQWPADGVPQRPAAWLMAVAKRRAVDLVRREANRESKYREMVERAPMTQDDMSVDDPADGQIEDDLLRLVFICCHPILGRDARVALTLRLLGGLSTQEIARAQLVPSATAGQRIARAKRTIAQRVLGNRVAAMGHVVAGRILR